LEVDILDTLYTLAIIGAGEECVNAQIFTWMDEICKYQCQYCERHKYSPSWWIVCGLLRVHIWQPGTWRFP